MSNNDELEAATKRLARMQELAPRMQALNAEIQRLEDSLRPLLRGALDDDERLALLKSAPEPVRAQFRELRRFTREQTDLNRIEILGEGPYPWPADDFDGV